MSTDKCPFNIWVWLEEHVVVLKVLHSLCSLCSTIGLLVTLVTLAGKNEPHWTLLVAWLLSVATAVATRIALQFAQAKRSEAAREAEVQRKLQEVEEGTARWLHEYPPDAK